MATQPNASGLRLLKIIKLLKGRSLTGLSHTEIATALSTPKPTISRDLATLVQEGFVTKLESDRYALSVAMLAIAEAHRLEISKGRERINELDRRVTAAAH
jgi:DNA-binding IclR family transcriptional regulator